MHFASKAHFKLKDIYPTYISTYLFSFKVFHMYMYICTYNVVYYMTFGPHPQTTHRGGEWGKKRESEEAMTAASYEVRGYHYQLLVVIDEWSEQ